MSSVNNIINTTYPVGGNGGYPTLHAVLTGNGDHNINSTALTNGQLLIGSTGSAPVAAAITPGTNVTVTNAAGSITINANAISSINIQDFTTSGSYAPSSGMVYCVIEAVAGGGGGGGAASAVTGCTVGSSGGAGGYIRATFTAATIGASQTITIGAGGAGGDNTGDSASNGGTTTVGSLITCDGGAGGYGDGGGSTTLVLGQSLNGGGASASSSINGYVGVVGGASGISTANYPSNMGATGPGGNSPLGSGAAGVYVSNAGSAGNSAGGGGNSAGGGGSAAVQCSQSSGYAGGNGGNGYVIITEYIS